MGSSISKEECDEPEKYQDHKGKIKLLGQTMLCKGLCLIESGEKFLARVSSSSYKITEKKKPTKKPIKHANKLALKESNWKMKLQRKITSFWQFVHAS